MRSRRRSAGTARILGPFPGPSRVARPSGTLARMRASPAGSTADDRPSPDQATTRPHLIIVMPAYNAALTLERTYADIPHDLVDRIILVDDVSRDETVD